MTAGPASPFDQLRPSPMDRALELARGVLGSTSPNPAVGCVIVRDGEIVGEGATQPPGGPHAERVALTQAGARARGSTMYVTLEPCCHHGRTPPCADAIIAAGVAEVRFSLPDPNPLVAGKGQAALEAAGVRTRAGEGEREARRINEAFLKWIAVKRPFVYAKFAVSLDGKIATRTGDSRWITGEEARRRAHQWRSIVDAVMIGVATLLRDDPQLTARDAAGRPCVRQPLRVIADSRGRTPVTARMLREPGQTLIAVTAAAPGPARRALLDAGADLLDLPAHEGRVDLDTLLQRLGQRDLTSVLVEGGGELLRSCFEGRLVDRVLAFVAPVIIGGREAPGPVAGPGVERVAEALRLQDVTTERLGDDTLISGYVGR